MNTILNKLCQNYELTLEELSYILVAWHYQKQHLRWNNKTIKKHVSSTLNTISRVASNLQQKNMIVVTKLYPDESSTGRIEWHYMLPDEIVEVLRNE